jgi:hypothetical protein
VIEGKKQEVTRGETNCIMWSFINCEVYIPSNVTKSKKGGTCNIVEK